MLTRKKINVESVKVHLWKMVKGHSKKIVAFMLSSANSFNSDTTNIWLNGKIGLELKFGIVNFKMLSNEKNHRFLHLQGAWI